MLCPMPGLTCPASFTAPKTLGFSCPAFSFTRFHLHTCDCCFVVHVGFLQDLKLFIIMKFVYIYVHIICILIVFIGTCVYIKKKKSILIYLCTLKYLVLAIGHAKMQFIAGPSIGSRVLNLTGHKAC